MRIKSESGHKWLLGWMRRVGCGLLVGCLLCSSTLPVMASSISKTEKEKKEAEQKLDEAKQKANQAQQSKDAAQSKVKQLSSELADLLAVIQVLENDMERKEAEIKQAQLDYDAAKEQEEKQYDAMKKRIKYMYEKGDTMYLDILLKSSSMSDLLNKTEYVQELYSYDKNMLTTFQETKQEVENLKIDLEEDKSEMEVMEGEYKEQEEKLESMIAKKKKEVNNFDSQYADAKKEAAAYAKTVEEKTAQIKKAKEEEAAKKKAAEEAAKKKAAEEAAKKKAEQKAKEEAKKKETTKGKSDSKGSSNSGPGSTAKSSGGTAEGRSVADYALKFVGNPYVYGGTSLTNGADCSGFTQSVYSRFGVSLPRTSSEQSSCGTSVDFANIQAGDLVFYAGHVAIYIGGGQIVHASSVKTGIKVSNVTYRTILGIQRVL